MSDRLEDADSGPSFVDETLDEHSGCMKLVADLEACLDRKPEEPERWLTELRDRLARLQGAMQQHFAGEESGPIFTSLPTRHPRLAAPLDELRAEHPLMLEQIEQVQAKAMQLSDPELFELRELNARVQLLIARIRRHEAVENELVIHAYWDEVGVGD